MCRGMGRACRGQGDGKAQQQCTQQAACNLRVFSLHYLTWSPCPTHPRPARPPTLPSPISSARKAPTAMSGTAKVACCSTGLYQ